MAGEDSYFPPATFVHHKLNASALLILADVEGFSLADDQPEWIIQSSFRFVQPRRWTRAFELVQPRTVMSLVGSFAGNLGSLDNELHRILNPHKGLHGAAHVPN